MKYYFYTGELIYNDNDNANANANKTHVVQGVFSADDEMSPVDVFNNFGEAS